MILIVGSTGTLGGMVTRRLLERGEDVRILVRPGSAYQALEAAGAEPVTGDLKDPSSLERACEGVDTVVTTANSAGRGGADTVDTVEMQGNRNLIDAAAAAGVRHFVFVSAIGAAPDSPVPFLRGKGLAEQRLQESGMGYTIVKPNLFMQVWVMMMVGRAVSAGGAVTLVGEGRRRHSMVSNQDVAEFIVKCVGNDAALGRTLMVGGPAPFTWHEVVAEYEKATGRPIEVRTVPLGTALPGLPPTVSSLASGLETFDTPIEMETTAREFGVRLTSLAEFVRATVA